ncbi:transcriptional regulator [Metallosphaera tengchongensis]|uniref:Transcriptional regulator n=1 Tax=Metallosphaera tengchongensis TaxID=1532350 RepID=A0A6N0NTP3_9CREN|nr:transcriptional regulator [Metallosphaera tengchongensis]QKQ99544.1 transcriptional regulator [Metallosphaera tengchongensis]
MKWETPCEQAFNVVIPNLRVALIRKLVERGIPVKKSTKIVGLSATSYEKRVKNEEKLKMIFNDPEVGDMLEALAYRIASGEKIEEISFCILCSKTRRIFGLPPCSI